MTELLTAQQMRAIEEAAIASGEVTGLELMERAGRGVVEAIFEEWPELKAGSFRAVVLCGPGNNGGDGFVVARLLKDWGWEVEVFLYGDPERLPPDARVNYGRWRERGEVRPITAAYNAFMRFHDDCRPDIWIDGLFGTGLTRPIPAEVGALLEDVRLSFSELIADPGGKVVALDLPSGISSDTGEALFDRGELTWAHVFTADGHHVDYNYRAQYRPLHCDLTVTFHAEKIGHRTRDAPIYCGKIVVKDIGL